MPVNYSVEQSQLGLSACQRLCNKSSWEIESLAQRAGWGGVHGMRMSIPIATAINMLVLSNAADHSIELQFMAAHLPGLRNEALLNLAENTSNWAFAGTSEADHQFWPMLYGDSSALRARVAPLLGASTAEVVWQLRYFSPSNVERISPNSHSRTSSGTPRFIVDAHNIAARVRSVMDGAMFTARVAASF